jgi:hypothetical protein
LLTDQVWIELLGPRKLMTLRIREDQGICAGLTPYDPDERARRLRLVVDTIHAFLMTPEQVFARQADHCCCCGKILTDIVSKTRGIGPECLRYFCSFTDWAQKPDSVERYRQKYYQETGFFPAL